MRAALLARAAPVHDFGSVVAGQLAEAIVAVNNRPLHNLCISQQEAGLCMKTRRGGGGARDGVQTLIKLGCFLIGPNEIIIEKASAARTALQKLPD